MVESNTNFPSGIHKDKDTSFSKNNEIDVKALNTINTITKKYESYVKRIYGTLEGFDDAIENATKTHIKRNEDKIKLEEKLDLELKAIGEEFGEDSEEYRNHISAAKKEISKFEDESREMALKINRDFIKQSFKNEAESNQIKYLDSEFARGNNLSKVNNEYYGELEKLKSTALDTFGEGFENREDFKKALMNLNATYIQEARNARKEDFKENHRIISSISDGFKDTFERNKTALQGVLGPLNLFIAPIQDFFGGFGMIFKGIKGGFNFLLNKFTKKTPTASDVIKSGPFGVGALYLGGLLTKLLGGERQDGGITDMLGGIFGRGAMNGIGGMVMKALPIASIAIGIIWMAIDAIRGVFKAKEWGTSKISAGLGGALGGMDKGIKGAFKNMGKWALIGAGVGSFIPVVGTIAGGLIGGAIGAILGFIGGEKLAKAFDGIKAFGAKALEWIKKTAVGVWNLLWNGLIKKPINLIKNLLKKAFNGMKSFGTKIIGWVKNAFNIDKFKSIFQSDGSLGKKIIESLKTLIVTALTFIPKILFGNTLMKNMLKNKKIVNAFGKLGEGVGKMFNGIKDLFSSKMEAMKEKWNGVKEFGGEVWEGIQNSELGQFVSKLFDSLENGITQFFKENPIGVWVESHIIQPIKNAFVQIGAWFGYIGDAFEKGGIKGALGAMTVGMFKKDKETGLTEFEQYKQNLLNSTDVTTVNDAIIRTDGSIIKTNPSDTLVALKDVPKSFDKVREDTSKVLNYNLENVQSDNVGVENKLSNIIDILSKILAKDLQVQMPPQTRGDLDLLISGALI